jgi:hypothetical protein
LGFVPFELREQKAEQRVYVGKVMQPFGRDAVQRSSPRRRFVGAPQPQHIGLVVHMFLGHDVSFKQLELRLSLLPITLARRPCQQRVAAVSTP